jgi:two-component system sensor histidine kinase CpxA
MASRIDALVSGQTRFLGDTAHELRSPLGRMQVAIELLDQRVSDADRAYLHDVRDDLNELVRLTDDLLEFTRTRLAVRDEPPRPTDIGDVVGRVMRTEGKGADIAVQVQDGIKAMARPDDLARALGNIVRNAVHHAGHAGPIRVSAGRRDDLVQIVVADAGPGVPDDALDQIFSPFYRVDPSRTRRSGGAGLGLAIARSAIEASGGSVTAANRTPSGLELIVTLPSASAPNTRSS